MENLKNLNGPKNYYHDIIKESWNSCDSDIFLFLEYGGGCDIPAPQFYYLVWNVRLARAKFILGASLHPWTYPNDRLIQNPSRKKFKGSVRKSCKGVIGWSLLEFGFDCYYFNFYLLRLQGEHGWKLLMPKSVEPK